MDFLLAKSSLDEKERKQQGEEKEFLPDLEDFEQNPGWDISAFLGDNAALKGEFKQWMKGMVNRAGGTLLEMYIKYGVLPSFILQILGRVKAQQLTENAEMKMKLRSLQAREKDAALIKDAVELALKWLPYTPQREKEFDRTYRAAGLLSRLAEVLPKLGPSRKGKRQQLFHVRIAAYDLASGLKKLRLERKRYDFDAVGDLLQIGFPEYIFKSGKDLDRIIREGMKIRESKS